MGAVLRYCMSIDFINPQQSASYFSAYQFSSFTSIGESQELAYIQGWRLKFSFEWLLHSLCHKNFFELLKVDVKSSHRYFQFLEKNKGIYIFIIIIIIDFRSKLFNSFVFINNHGQYQYCINFKTKEKNTFFILNIPKLYVRQ